MSQLLSVDLGAKRCGWALLEPGPTYVDSGILYCDRSEKEEFQHYRMRVEHQAYWFFDELLMSRHIGKVVNEIIPAAGSGNFAVATQSYLANCVGTALHCAAFGRGVEIAQVSARSVQARIAKRADSRGITKAQVRNGVIELMPEVGQKLTAHLLEWDRWDAIAIGLASLGYKL